MPSAPSHRRRALKSPRCHTCDRTIHVPSGWSKGAAVRRHYWAKHRDVMEKPSARMTP